MPSAKAERSCITRSERNDDSDATALLAEPRSSPSGESVVRSAGALGEGPGPAAPAVSRTGAAPLTGAAAVVAAASSCVADGATLRPLMEFDIRGYPQVWRVEASPGPSPRGPAAVSTAHDYRPALSPPS